MAACCCCCCSIRLNEEAREGTPLDEASAWLLLRAGKPYPWPWELLLLPLPTLPHWLGRSRASAGVSEPAAAGPCGGNLLSAEP